MTSRAIISLALILSLLTGIISPMIPMMPQTADSSLLSGSAQKTIGKGSGSTLLDHSIPWDDAIVLKAGNHLPVPVTYFALLWLAFMALACIAQRYRHRRIDPSPPFLAPGRQRTYLRNSVLLI